MPEPMIHNETVPTYAIDIVCGMKVPITTKMIMSNYEGETYFFCSLHCKERFDNAPESYAAE